MRLLHTADWHLGRSFHGCSLLADQAAWLEWLVALARDSAVDAILVAGDLYDRALAIVARERKATTSYIQRRLEIGYNRAARIIERMEAEGVVSAANHVGKREVLARVGE